MSDTTKNALATVFGSNVPMRGDMKAAAAAMSVSAQTGAIGAAPDGSQYLNFSGKQGAYSFGAEKEDVSEDEIWLVNWYSFAEGWKCWKGGSPVAQRLASIFSDAKIPVPDFTEHGPFNESRGEGWSICKAFVLKSIDEDDRQGYFSTNSKSGVGSVSDLQRAMAERLEQGRPHWPLIQLGREKFTAQGATNYKPVFKIFGWLDDANLQVLADDADADIEALCEASESGTVYGAAAPEAAPEKPVAKVAAKAPAKPVVEEVAAPVRRRARPTI